MFNRDLRGAGVLLDSFIENSSIRIILGVVLIFFSSISLWIMEEVYSIYGLISLIFIVVGLIFIYWKVQELLSK